MLSNFGRILKWKILDNITTITWKEIPNVKLEISSDIDMHFFVEEGTRGGISYIAKRYSKANNKYMKN